MIFSSPLIKSFMRRLTFTYFFILWRALLVKTFLVPYLPENSRCRNIFAINRLERVRHDRNQVKCYSIKETSSNQDLVSNTDISPSITWKLLPKHAQVRDTNGTFVGEDVPCFRNIRDEQEITDLIIQIQSISSSILNIRRQNKKIYWKQEKNNRRAIPHCRALVQMLKDQAMYSSQPFSSSTKEKIVDMSVLPLLSDALSRATVQALRGAADANDYNLIMQIVDVSVQFASSFRYNHGMQEQNEYTPSQHLLLQPRLFGEAIQTLTRTTAGYSKLRQIWQYFKKSISNEICPYPDQATELNAMITALHSRKRIRAALSLYEENKQMINVDSFTASALFDLLLKSIESEIQIESKGDNDVHTCWQMNDAMEILEYFEKKYLDAGQETQILNNQAYSMILKLNDMVIKRNAEKGMKYDGASFALSILERMKKLNISPDVITCTSIMSTLAKANQWKAAYSLLSLMQNSEHFTDSHATVASSLLTNGIGTNWVLPKPNIYTYSAAISACARDNQMDLALEIFNSLRDEGDNCYVENNEKDTIYCIERNTWVYNTVLAACSGGSQEGVTAALDLLQNMQDDAEIRGLDTRPNTVTFNTILAALIRGELGKDAIKKVMNFTESNVVEEKDKIVDQVHVDEVLFSQVDQEENEIVPWKDEISTEEELVKDILSRMQQQNITRDTITYHNSILACSKTSPDAAIRILKNAFVDHQSNLSESSIDMSTIINTALSVCASRGAIYQMMDIFDNFFTHQILPDATTYHLILRGACRSKEKESAFHFLRALNGNQESALYISNAYNVKIFPRSHILEERHYFAVVDDCIKKDRIKDAMEILNLMKVHGKFSPSLSSLTSIIISCSKKAIEIASNEFKNTRKQYKRQNLNYAPIDRTSSQSRAKAALNLLRSINSSYIPSAALFSVAKACAATGLWDDAYTLIGEIHTLSLRSDEGDINVFSKKSKNKRMSSNVKALPTLHRYVLNVCATYGDISNALRTVDMIQNFTQDFINLSSDTKEVDYNDHFVPILSSILLSEESEDLILPIVNRNFTWATSDKVQHFTGMDGNNWKLLIIAASKARNWKICLSTMQLLRSYIEDTHPQNLEHSDVAEHHLSNKEYENLSHALSSAIFCFESCKQYAWAIRVLDDWIKWSGRRPPKDAIIATCRVLAAKGRGQQVKDVVSKVMNVAPTKMSNSNDRHNLEETIDYELSIYSYAINALYKNGLYDIADEIYLEGVSRDMLLWPVVENRENAQTRPEVIGLQTREALFTMSSLELDLHGMTLAIAHSAVRTALQKEVQQISLRENVSPLDDHEWSKDVIIITGKGLNSAERFRPILRPEVQRMLTEEFYPPLSTTSVPNNMGALQIPAKDVDVWLRHQRQQRGAYMLTVADMLKSVTGVSRLKKTILKIGKNEERNE